MQIQDNTLNAIKEKMIDKVIEELIDMGYMTTLQKTAYKAELLSDIQSRTLATTLRLQSDLTDANAYNKTAYELGAVKIATGHNLDDEIQSFLMSFARGDTIKFSYTGAIEEYVGDYSLNKMQKSGARIRKVAPRSAKVAPVKFSAKRFTKIAPQAPKLTIHKAFNK